MAAGSKIEKMDERRADRPSCDRPSGEGVGRRLSSTEPIRAVNRGRGYVGSDGFVALRRFSSFCRVSSALAEPSPL
jgi:hypothetical protein